MELSIGLSTSQLRSLIKENIRISKSQKRILEFLLNNDYSFVHISFGNEICCDWNFIYTEMKSYFLPALLNSDWTFSFSESFIDENLVVLSLAFKKKKKIRDFLLAGTYEEDGRERFNLLDIYLTKADMKKAQMLGVLKNM